MGITVLVSGPLTLSGAHAGNYTRDTPTTTADIDKADLTITSGGPTPKTYDGTTGAAGVPQWWACRSVTQQLAS